MTLAMRTRPVLPPRGATLVAIIVSGAMLLPASAGAARQDAGARPIVSGTRIRPLDAKAADLLEQGPLRSRTIKRLIDTLEQSDVIVFVSTGLLMISGETVFVTESSGTRFLRIVLSVPEADDRLLGWLGHELQHAVEIATAPEVTSVETMAAFYRHVGNVSGSGVCTPEAQKLTATVSAEVAAEPWPWRELRH
ncbi:MAG: hypothetical protein A3H96_09535 [Acidobacteria bacterium RIFCSPLOWO2_02_FULL_67_36]|nr:MAG: hypothetical protein A3H96_09535 [Acidobacteria bacterium RIFCSPLOWO2_02_FULL_67_36]OFW24988.1 MAG: hypothetical protein A3G21_16205 [Acidobacteria bacterium RIFCSPLOWO2_12_FULL_66_21]